MILTIAIDRILCLKIEIFTKIDYISGNKIKLNNLQKIEFYGVYFLTTIIMNKNKK